SQETSPLFSRAPKSFRDHRQHALSVEAIPRQTIMKALVSRPPHSAQQFSSIAAPLSGFMGPPINKDNRTGTSSSQMLSAVLSDMQLGSPKADTPSAARYP